MKFALFILASWLEKDTSAQSRIYDEALEQVEFAEELGFDSVWVAEHHSSRYGIFPSLTPILSYMAARTKKIRIGTGVSVLPFHNPIRLAEEAAMLDLLSHGRLEFGVGRGSADYEYGNFKVEFDSRDERTREVLDIILGLWTTPEFSYNGKYHQIEKLTIAPTTLQQPHPPVIVASDGDQAIARVADFGDGWMAHAARSTPDAIEAGRRRLERLFAENGRDFSRFEVTLFGGKAERATTRTYADAGVDRIVYLAREEAPEATVKRLERWAAEVL